MEVVLFPAIESETNGRFFLQRIFFVFFPAFAMTKYLPSDLTIRTEIFRRPEEDYDLLTQKLINFFDLSYVQNFLID